MCQQALPRSNEFGAGSARKGKIWLISILAVALVTGSGPHAHATAIAAITSPVEGAVLDGLVPIYGTASNGIDTEYILRFVDEDGIQTRIFSCVCQVSNGLLGTLNVKVLLGVEGNPYEGPGVIHLWVSDPAVSIAVATINVIIDRTYPVMTGFTAIPSLATVGNVRLDVTASETLQSAPAVMVSGVPAAFVSQSGLVYTFQHQVTEATPQGTVPVSITLTDRAGHVTNASASFVVDRVAPQAVTDLEALSLSPSSVQLRWTAPHDDGPAGKAASYEIRYALQPPGEYTFPDGVLIPAGAPQAAGTTETLEVEGLQPQVLHYFALRSRDSVDNASPLSNVATWLHSPPASKRYLPLILR